MTEPAPQRAPAETSGVPVKNVPLRRKGATDLHTNEKLLADVQRLAKIGSWIWTITTGKVEWSEEVYLIFGLTPTSFRPTITSVMERFHPEDRHLHRELRRHVLEEDTPFSFEARIIHSDGTIRILVLVAEGQFDDSGKLLRIFGIVQDITERKRSEEALLLNKRQLEMALQGTGLATWYWNVRTSDLVVSEQWAGMLGYTTDELAPDVDTIVQLMHPDDRLRVQGALRNHFQGLTESFEAEHRMRHKSGEWTWVLSNGRVIERTTDGAPMRACGIQLDISKRKQAETECEKLENQIRQAQKLESIGGLAGGIAHDFNNILASIIGFTELALDDVGQETQLSDNLQEVYVAAIRAKDLVNQILTFARQSNEERKPIPVDACIREVLNLLRSSLPASVEIRHDIRSNSLIMGNATQLYQVFMNLCTNAAHAMEHRGGILEIILEDAHIDKADTMTGLELNPGVYLKAVISDTGVGIGPEIIDKIFEPYFTTKDTGRGTGMGLAVVHGIIASYGGKIGVESTPGHGTVVTMYLPITKKRGIDCIAARSAGNPVHGLQPEDL